MPRPCAAAHPVPVPERCHLCDLCLHDPAYGRLWGCEAAPTSAGVVRKAANFVRAAARHVLAGLPRAPEGERTRRVELCLACPEHDPAAGVCRRCGCGVKKKAGWLGERCPLGKW